MNTTTATPTPEALRLADAWDSAISTRRHVAIGCEMAEKLRRQHAKIARLTAENEALKAERARSGLAHRKAVQEAVREALQEAKKACENLPAPEACSGVERSLWDVATMACAEAVGKVGAT